MARVINDTCISCGACEGSCPVGAISMGDDHMKIDAAACIDCGACEGTCPMGAIAAEEPARTDAPASPLGCGGVLLSRRGRGRGLRHCAKFAPLFLGALVKTLILCKI